MASLQNNPAPFPLRGFVIVGAGVLAGVLAFMFWPAEPIVAAKATQVQTLPKVDSVQPIQPVRLGAGLSQTELASKLELEAPKASEIIPPELTELTLTQRLDDFFLPNVSLENLPLGQALAKLKQMLLTIDKDKALALHKLVVTVPTSALGRLVTLHSASISYLEAVRTVAAMAGCEVDLGEQRITLKTLPGAWPQVAQKRSILDVLEGLFTKDGKPMSQDPDQVVKLKEDIASLGLRLGKDDSLNLTVSQQDALRRLMDERRRRESSLIPPLTVYLLPADHLGPIFQVSPAQVLELMMTLYAQGFSGYGTLPYARLDSSIAQQVLIIARVGETVSVSQYTTIPTDKKAEVVAAATEPVMKWTWDGYTPNSYGVLIVIAMPLQGLTTAQDGLLSVGEGENAPLMQTESSSAVMVAEILRVAADRPDIVEERATGSGETAPTTVPPATETAPVTPPAAP